MIKTKFKTALRLGNFFTHHPWLKLISLVLAVFLWFFVKGEINKFNY